MCPSTCRPRPPCPTPPDKSLFLTIKDDLTLAVGETPVMPGLLAVALDTATGGNKDQRVFLRAAKTVSYGELTEVMNQLRTAGYLKVALVGLEAKASR
jgi:biopolymer transport protein ExbD